ncbi:hypothetical protein Esti_000253 [Eimeria stiedai]
MQAEHKRAAAASRQAATAASASKACGGCPAHEQPQPACGSCGPSDEGSSVSNEAPSDLGSSRPPSAAPGRRRQAMRRKQETQARETDRLGLCACGFDDDFEDAEVDEAEETPPLPTTQAPAVPQGMQQQQQQQGSSLARNEEEKGETQRAQQKSNAKAAEQIGSGKYEDCEEGSGLTLDDVSDLDDREPPTSDGIFAFYEKVERSAAGAARRTSKWRVLLRYGIIRVGGREIPFDKITGEFSF